MITYTIIYILLIIICISILILSLYKKQIICSVVFLMLSCVLTVGAIIFYNLPLSYVEEVKQIEDIAEFQDFPDDVNKYIVIKNVSKNASFVYIDNENNQIEIPISSSTINVTQGNHAYLLIVDSVVYKGNIRISTSRNEYRFFVPDVNANKLLYIQGTPVSN